MMFKRIFKKKYSTFYLKGTDPRVLTKDQQFEIAQFVAQDSNANSFFVYNSDETKVKMKSWANNLGWIQPFYAMKTNPIPSLVNQLIKGGVGMACTSRAQLKMALEAGLRRTRIIYSNPVKDQVQLRWAHDNGIQLTVADSIEQLRKIKELAPKMKILWRISAKRDNKTQSPTKFGDQLFSNQEISERMKQIKNLKMNIQGVHFHCNPTEHKNNVFSETISLANNIIKIGREYGHKMQIMNVGGAFSKDGLSPKIIEDLKVTKNNPLNYKVIAQPGRYFCSSSCYLLTRVLAKRIKSGKPCYQINDSLYHAFNCILLDSISFENRKDLFYSKVVSTKNQSQNKKKKQSVSDSISPVGKLVDSTVFGMTCDGLDVIANNFYLPQQVDVGDWLCFSGMGANTYGPRTTFNGMRSVQKIIHWSSKIQNNTAQQSTNSI